MHLPDATSAIALDDGQNYFIYHEWMKRGDISRDVTHAVIHWSIRVIRDEAFLRCSQYAIVIFNGELEEIGGCAFYHCD